MTCRDMEAGIAGYLAGEPEDRAEIESHLVACAECRANFSTAKAGWDAALEWKVPTEAPAVLVRHRREPGGGGLRLLQAGTLAASLVIAFVVGTSPGARPETETPAPLAVRPESTGLASLRPSVGLLFVQDEQGRPAGELAIRRLEVKVDIRDGIARTEIEEVFQNRTDRRLEGTFQFPLPPDASISRLAMEIDGKLMEGEVVEREKARKTYEGIVRSMKDPALLEWMPGGIFQCRIFPIEPRSDKRIVLAYTQALPVFDGRGRYVYPLSGESTRELGIGRFEFAAMIRSTSKLVNAESTSHDAPTIRLDDRTMRTTFAFSDFRPKADFVVAYETEPAAEIQVAAHRPPGPEPGYFAAFVTPRGDPEGGARRERKLFFMMDVSGSVTRAEMEASRVVVRRMIGALRPSDRFRIGCHNIEVGAMAEDLAPDEEGRRKAERYLADLVPTGASDVAMSMATLLSLVPEGGELVYVGEGTPTWGERDPARIVETIRGAIGARRVSIRTVAVGSDADRNLLETLSREFGGGAHAVSPSDDVASRADEIARTLGRPALSGLKAEFEGAVSDAAPGTLGTLYVGERLLVTGRYGAGPAKLVLTGRLSGGAFRREFVLPLPDVETENLHVKRMWAQRRLTDLASLGEARRADVVKLSVEHQVMTPYTSFLVLENERAYEEHAINRTKKDADQTKDPGQAKAGKAGPAQPAVVKQFDVNDLVYKLLAEEQPVFDGEALANLIKATIEKQTWNDNEGRNCIFQNGLLIVRNSPEVQGKVRNFLEVLRDSTGILVSVESRFLTVEEGFQKQVGRDFSKPRFDEVSALEMYNVQDMTYGLQDFPGVNITLSEDALGRRDVSARVPTFIDPDGGGGPLLHHVPALNRLGQDSGDGFVTRESANLETNDLRAKTFETLMRFDPQSRAAIDALESWGVDASGYLGVPTEGLPRMLKSAPSELRQDGHFSEGTGTFGKLLVEQQVEAQLVGVPTQKANDTSMNIDELVKTLNERTKELLVVMQEIQQADRQSKDLSSLESQYQELARERMRLQESMSNLTGSGAECGAIPPRRAVSGMVTAVATELDLVVISIGRDAGVNEGDEFTIQRGTEVAGKIVIDRVDRAWSSGRLTQKGKEAVRVGDSASSGLPSGARRPSPDDLRVLSAAGDVVMLIGAEKHKLQVGTRLMMWRFGSYLSAVRVIEVRGNVATTRIIPELRAADVAAGDPALVFDSLARLWPILPASVRQDLVSKRLLAAARVKLQLLRALDGGSR